jgi:hypothetical protein
LLASLFFISASFSKFFRSFDFFTWFLHEKKFLELNLIRFQSFWSDVEDDDAIGDLEGSEAQANLRRTRHNGAHEGTKIPRKVNWTCYRTLMWSLAYVMIFKNVIRQDPWPL